MVPAACVYRSPGVVYVEGDASSASYFLALGAIGGGPLRVEGVGTESVQGDVRFADTLKQMGVRLAMGPNWIEARAPAAGPLRGIELDCNHIPDAAMTLAAMALYADGPSTLRNIASWRVKETDRIAAMAIELRKLGASVEEGADYIRITPPAGKTAWKAASIHTYDDHRVAMCFSLAAFNPAKLPVRIEDPKCVAKTFPDYFEALFSVVEARAADIPVITIDGPTASGKGTLSASVAAGHTVVPVLVPEPGRTPAPAGTPLTQAESAQLKTLMRAVVTEGGHAPLAAIPGEPVMAKSGTASYGKDVRFHGWMIAIQGDLAVATFTEDATSGTADAEPLLVAFLEAAANR